MNNILNEVLGRVPKYDLRDITRSRLDLNSTGIEMNVIRFFIYPILKISGTIEAIIALFRKRTGFQYSLHYEQANERIYKICLFAFYVRKITSPIQYIYSCYSTRGHRLHLSRGS